MAQNIRNFDISKTFSNVILTTVTDQPDTDGIPATYIPLQRKDNMTLRDQGRLQDGAGYEVPLVLGRNVIEVESEPATALSPMRRADLVGLQAAAFINSMLWS